MIFLPLLDRLLLKGPSKDAQHDVFTRFQNTLQSSWSGIRTNTTFAPVRVSCLVSWRLKNSRTHSTKCGHVDNRTIRIWRHHRFFAVSGQPSSRMQTPSDLSPLNLPTLALAKCNCIRAEEFLAAEFAPNGFSPQVVAGTADRFATASARDSDIPCDSEDEAPISQVFKRSTTPPPTMSSPLHPRQIKQEP